MSKSECYDCGKQEEHLPHFRMVRMCEDCIDVITEEESLDGWRTNEGGDATNGGSK